MAIKVYTQAEIEAQRRNTVSPQIFSGPNTDARAGKVFNTPTNVSKVVPVAPIISQWDTVNAKARSVIDPNKPVISQNVPNGTVASSLPPPVDQTGQSSSPSAIPDVPSEFGDSVAGLQKWYDKDPIAYNKWLAAGGKANQSGVISPEEQAQAKIDADRKAQREEELKRLGHYVTPATQAEEDLINNQKNEANMTELERQIASMNKIDRAQFKTQSDNAAASVAGASAQFSQGAEGVQSASTALVAPQFASKTQGVLDIANEQLSNVMIKRGNQLKDLKDAQDANDVKRVDAIRSQLATTQNDIVKAQTEASKAAADAKKEAADLITAQGKARTDAFSALKDLPAGSFAVMDIPTIAASFGVDAVTAGALKSLDTQKAALQITDPEYLKKKADLNKTIEETKWLGMTPEQKNLSTYQNMLKTDPKGASTFATLLGIDTKQASAYADNVKAALDIYKETGVWNPPEGKYRTSVVNGNLAVDVPVGQVPPNGRGQCGEFVNDTLGTPNLMGDSIQSKKKVINSAVPLVGSAFVMDTGNGIGHTGIVTAVNPDGSIDIIDSNRHGNEKVDTGHIQDPKTSGIVGYYNPGAHAPNQIASANGTAPETVAFNPKPDTLTAAGPTTESTLSNAQEEELAKQAAASGKWTDVNEYLKGITGTFMQKEARNRISQRVTALKSVTGPLDKEATIALMRSGSIPKTEFLSLKNKAIEQGWGDEFIKVLNDPKIQPLNPVTAQKFGVDSALTQYQLDDQLKAWKEADLGNRDFQGLYHNPAKTAADSMTEADKMRGFVQLGEDLQSAKKLFEQFRKNGGHLGTAANLVGKTFAKGVEFAGLGTDPQLELIRQIEQITGTNLVKKVKDISGVAVSDREFSRLQQFSPNTSQSDSQFLKNLDKNIADYDASMKAKASRFGFSSPERMKAVINGEVEFPTMDPTPPPAQAPSAAPQQFTLPEDNADSNPF